MSISDPQPPARAPTGGGFLLVIALVVGVLLGTILGQPTIGFLGGGAIGIAILIVLWLKERR